MKSVIRAATILLPIVIHAEGAVEASKFIMCRSQKIVRTIRIEKVSDGCETVYTKAGVDRVVGSGRHQESCESVLNNIRRNLEDAHWNCREVDSAAISDLSE